VWIFVIISGAIIVILSIVTFILIKKMPRKQRANESQEAIYYKDNKDNIDSEDKNYNSVNGEEQNKFGIDN
jgi:CRISPR/Cas system-associated protein Cas5 (RAMP superfamily)